MQNQDDTVLKKIQELFNNNSITTRNFYELELALTDLYRELSFSRSYMLQEIFPKIPSDYKIGEKAILKAEHMSQDAQQEWHGSEGGYVSLREVFKERTGIDVDREYSYPDSMSPREFQESFPTQLCKDITDGCVNMARYGLMMMNEGVPDIIYDTAVGWKLFVEKEKPVASRLIKEAYRKFWKVNSDILGYEELKTIHNFDEMRAFLMGVASEIPLDDVSAYLRSCYHDDKKIADELNRNYVRLNKEFQGHDVNAFNMTDKTWEKHVQPFLDKRKTKESKKKKSSDLKGVIENLKNTPSRQKRGRVV